LPPLSFEKFFFEHVKRGLQEGPGGNVANRIGFCIDQELAQCRVVPKKAIVRETVKPQRVIIEGADSVRIRDPAERGGAMGMQLTVFLNMDEKRRTSFMLRSTYIASPSSLRLDSEQCSMTLPGGRAKSFKIWQNVFPSSFKYPPSILMMAGHLDSDEGRTAGMA
jgi:hypothetical protein